MTDRAIYRETDRAFYPSLYAFQAEFNGDLYRRYSKDKCQSEAEWYGLDQGDPEELIHTGTMSILPEIHAAAETGKAQALTPTYTFDTTGDYPDIDRYLANEPECMVSTPLVPQPLPATHIIVNMGARSELDPTTIRDRGTYLLAAIERARLVRSVRVTIAFAATRRRGYPRWCLAIDVADTRGAYNPELVHYAISSPQLKRIWQFNSNHLLDPVDPDKYGDFGSYSSVYDFSPEEVRFITHTADTSNPPLIIPASSEAHDADYWYQLISTTTESK